MSKREQARLKGSNPEQFREALTKFASDPSFREEAMRSPEIVQENFKLSLEELQALRQVAIMSGADVSEVDKVRAKVFANRAGRVEATDVDVSCCSCCCCCCGETAVQTIA
ncbi:MAG: hypothetical protein M3277_11545 [Actinomycetota bacterium]|nr:hypothetical protein [Actinomycetota bacterium]